MNLYARNPSEVRSSIIPFCRCWTETQRVENNPPSTLTCQIWGDTVWFFGVLLYMFKIALLYLHYQRYKISHSENQEWTNKANKSLAQYIWQWNRSSFPDHCYIVLNWDRLSLLEILAKQPIFIAKKVHRFYRQHASAIQQGMSKPSSQQSRRKHCKLCRSDGDGVI